MHSIHVYDLLADLVLGRQSGVRRLKRALAAPPHVWERVLAFEGIGERTDRALTNTGARAGLPPGIDRVFREATNSAFRQAVLVGRGLADIAALARQSGYRVIALKGAARLLAGELPGTRSLTDIDLLVPSPDDARFHTLLQRELGYQPTGLRYEHHLPALTKPGSLGIEVHGRLGPADLPLNERMLDETRTVAAGTGALEIPSPTNMVLHTLEHATGTNWMVHFRLRDIADVASLFSDEVSAEDVHNYVARAPRERRRVFSVLLSAAHEIEPRAPQLVERAWSTVRRVARARLALAQLPRDRNTANRVYRYASVIAEGSPGAMLRAGMSLLRRATAIVMLAAIAATGACSDSTGPEPIEVPDFVFVSDSLGIPGIYLFSNDTVTRLSAADDPDDQPHNATGKIVFVSRRDGNPEIYIADLDLSNQVRLTNDGATDGEPALDLSGNTIAFVSRRSGTPRIWLMDANGANQRALATGSQTFTPEGAPAWSPSGGRLAFTSTRTGTSQVFVLDTATGQAEQLSHETGGAFSPVWSADGNGVYFISVTGVPSVKRAAIAGGDAAVVASGDRVLGDPSCVGSVCLVVDGADTTDGDILAVSAGRQSVPVLVRSANDRQPSVIAVP